jgi:hypothetical protein
MNPPTHHEIQVRSYFLWEKYGAEIPGEPLRDWIEAELFAWAEYRHARGIARQVRALNSP